MHKKYVIGLDYGTLSGRAVLVDCLDGTILASSVKNYPHGVMDRRLPGGELLSGSDWALQHPQDYLDVLKEIIPDIVKKSGVDADDIIGIGLDFTSCTMLPVNAENVPLCLQDKYRSEPHAYVKLWKHHGAQPQADRINELLEQRGEINNAQFGGKISSELLLPKILQIAEEAASVYGDADQLLEAGDWVVQVLTGERKRSAAAAGEAAGGYDEIGEAVTHMSRLKDVVYQPDSERAARYEELYEIYNELIEMFDPEKNGVMHRLHKLR